MHWVGLGWFSQVGLELMHTPSWMKEKSILPMKRSVLNSSYEKMSGLERIRTTPIK